MKLFVSYDHYGDSRAYELFLRLFGANYPVARDVSIERELGEADPGIFRRNLKATALADADCTVVLCGARTHLDPFVDWEIHASLEAGKGLIAVTFPGNPSDASTGPTLPARLQDNFDGGFAVHCRWVDLTQGRVDFSSRAIFAVLRERSLIRNDRPPMPPDRTGG